MVTVLPINVAKLVFGLVFPRVAFPAFASMQLAEVKTHCAEGCVSVKVTATPSVVIGRLVNAATDVLALFESVNIFVTVPGTPLVPEIPKAIVPVPPKRTLLMLMVGLSSSTIV